MEWSRLREQVLERIKPSDAETNQTRDFARRLISRVDHVVESNGIRGIAEVHGSVRHGTWLAGAKDLDVFIVVEEGDRDTLKQVIKLLQESLEGELREAYAEHPYLQAEIEGYSVDLVPCFRMSNGEAIHSSTDRTPLHSAYLAERLTPSLRDDARLLKQFTRGIDVYGAEIKVKGFSGYLCELLLVHYGSFMAVMQAAAGWKRGVNVTGASGGDWEDPLVVIDPVDGGRNVASALSPESFWSFVYAAERFTAEPRLGFFFPEALEPGPGKVLNCLKEGGSSYLFLVVEEGGAEIPDVLWGMLYRTLQAVTKALRKNGFTVLRSGAWSNEENRHVLTFELASHVIPRVAKQVGPPCGIKEGSKRFIEAHRYRPGTVAGPYIEDERWVVHVQRETTHAGELVKSLLRDGGRGIGVSRILADRITMGYSLVEDESVEPYLSQGFESWLMDFIEGRPRWLD